MYKINLTPEELNTIARILQEWTYRIVKPILENIAQQVDKQNQSLHKTKSNGKTN